MQYRQILFIELLGGIGDVVIALPAIHALARSHPQANLTVLTFAPGGELLEADPMIHQVVYATKGQARQAVENLLCHETFDVIVSDTNYDGIAELIQEHSCTHHNSVRTVTNLWRSPPSDQRVGDRFIEILQAEGLVFSTTTNESQPEIYLTATEQTIARQAFAASYRPLVFLCPDAGMAIKQWPLDRFVIAGKALQQRYGATVIVPVGAEVKIAEQIVAAIGGSARTWPRESLRGFAAAVAQADLVIAADTGPARIAAALNVPTITLFGPSWAGRYGQPAPHHNLQGFPSCPERLIHNFTEQCCWYSGDCPLEWQTCLEDIAPNTVLEAAAIVLRKAEDGEQRTEDALHSNFDSRLSDPWRSVRNLLVMRLDNMGDVMMTSPALRALRHNLPEATITLMASPAGAATAPLLPWVDQVLPWRVLWQDLGRLDFDPAREWQLIETLKAHQFDAAIIFTSFSQSPHPAAVICALAGIPLRLGESKEQDWGTLTHAVPAAADTIHQVDRNLRLIESVGFQVSDRRLCLSLPPSAQQTVTQLLQPTKNSPTPHTPHPTPYLLLNPWTTCQSRNYSVDRFAIAARQLSEITGWPVVVTGVAKDRERSRLLLEILGNCAIDLIGATQLVELVALVAGARLMLTNNTSTMHIADAMGTPSVVLFAGTELESQWRPRHSPARLLRRPTVCSPCYAFTCPYELQCLDIAPETVVAAALELLQLTPANYRLTEISSPSIPRLRRTGTGIETNSG